MKLLLFSLILFLNANFIFAQKCQTTIDEFTNEKVTNYSYYKERNYWPPMKLNFELKKNICKFDLTICYMNKLEVIIPKGSELLLKLENGEILKFTTQADATPQSFVHNNNIFSDYIYSLSLTLEDINKLAETKVKMLRFPNAFAGGTTDTDEYSKAIKKGAECISGKDK
jgi:hypothetical protein